MYKYKAGCRLYSIHKNEGGQKSNVQKKAYLGISSLIVSTPDDKDYKFTARVHIYSTMNEMKKESTIYTE